MYIATLDVECALLQHLGYHSPHCWILDPSLSSSPEAYINAESHSTGWESPDHELGNPPMVSPLETHILQQLLSWLPFTYRNVTELHFKNKPTWKSTRTTCWFLDYNYTSSLSSQFVINVSTAMVSQHSFNFIKWHECLSGANISISDLSHTITLMK